MTLKTSVSHLLNSPRDNQTLVAFSHTQQFVWGSFLLHVAQTVVRLNSEPTPECALFTRSAYWFAVGFLATVHSGKKLILLPNVQTEALHQLPPNSLLLTDQDAALFETFRHTIDLSQQADQTTPLNWQAKALNPLHCQISIFTSGSSGLPTVVQKTLANFEAELECLESLWGEQIQSRSMLASVSHQHIYGVLFRVLWPLCAERPFLEGLIEYPEQLTKLHGSDSVLVASPALLKRVANESDLVLPPLIFSSGGPLDEAVNLALRVKTHTTIYEVFGSSETGGVATRDLQKNPYWALMPNVQAHVGENGLLQIKSAHCMSGECEMSDRADFIDDCHFKLGGRADRIIKLEEKRVSLTAIENHLLTLEWITTGYAMVLHAGRDLLCLAVELTPKGETLLAQQGPRKIKIEIKTHLLQLLEPVTLPRKIRFVPNMPLTPQGKIDRAYLQRLFEHE